MKTDNALIFKPDEESLARAATFLRQGELVAFPTETVYGLGGDATNARAVASIYEAKGRPQFNPLIIHVADKDEALPLVQWSETAESLANAFWPGPLTLVLPRTADSPVALLAGGGLDTLAIRCPDHAVARALIRHAGRPLAAPSANASGKLSPTRAEHVRDSLVDGVAMILDGGACPVGVESTVLDLTSGVPTILRHGGLPQEALETFCGTVREYLHDPEAPKSPGMLLSHYAPDLPVRLHAREAAENEAFLVFGDETPFKGGAVRQNLSRSGDLLEAAANLFAMLRELDASGCRGIAVAPIPQSGLGAAINDRLARAARR